MRSLRSHADASLPASRPRTCRSTLAGWRLAGPDEGTWARHIASVSRYEDRYDPKDRDRLICCSSASASLPYLSPDLDESRETASSTGENAVHPKQPQILASQRLACVVAGVVEMAEYEFDSHAIPPPTPERERVLPHGTAPADPAPQSLSCRPIPPCAAVFPAHEGHMEHRLPPGVHAGTDPAAWTLHERHRHGSSTSSRSSSASDFASAAADDASSAVRPTASDRRQLWQQQGLRERRWSCARPCECYDLSHARFTAYPFRSPLASGRVTR